jgi:hypothetical protein
MTSLKTLRIMKDKFDVALENEFILNVVHYVLKRVDYDLRLIVSARTRRDTHPPCGILNWYRLGACICICTCTYPGVPCVCVDGVDGDKSEVDGGSGCGFQFCPCISQHTSSWTSKVTHVVLPRVRQLLQLFIKDASFLELVVYLVQFQCRSCSIGSWAGVRLRAYAQQTRARKANSATSFPMGSV